jgi:hypothetical protein
MERHPCLRFQGWAVGGSRQSLHVLAASRQIVHLPPRYWACKVRGAAAALTRPGGHQQAVVPSISHLPQQGSHDVLR